MEIQQQPDVQAGAGRLPVQPTPFVGRRDEIESVAALLAVPDCRLVTLVGTGGIGKTRLSLEVAARLRQQHPDGAYLVELAGVSDPALVARTVASVLELGDEAGRSVLETLMSALRDKRLLLILDNCEHLLGASAELAWQLLAACPELCILATSREPLRTAGEVVWEVPPLSLPGLNQISPPHELLAVDAVALFVDRAHRIMPTFELTTQNAPWVAQVCHRLDGVPLAIELAASRIRLLSVAEIYNRLDDALRLLAGGDRLAPVRQRTVRATFDWSYGLLSHDEQNLLQRLSVFSGTFSLAAAEDVCSGGGLHQAGILDLVGSLVDKSLIVAERADGRTRRLRLLETIGAYAGEKLDASGTGGEWHDRHLAWYMRFAEELEPKVSWGIAGVQTLESIDRELDNLRGALRWAIEMGRAEEGHRLASAMAWYWLRRGHLHESRRWYDEILAMPGEVTPEAKVGALHGAGTIFVHQGDHQRSVGVLREAVALGCVPQCSQTAAWSLHRLAVLAFHEGELDLADDWLAQSLRAFEEMDDKAGVAIVHIGQGWVACRQGDHERAEALIQDSLAFLREIEDVIGVTHALRSLADVARRQGELEAATAHLQEALQLNFKAGAMLELTWCLEDLAGVLCAQGRPQLAARLFGAAEALRQTIGPLMASGSPTFIAQDLVDTRASLGEAVFEAAFTAGGEMTREQAVEFALGAVAGDGRKSDARTRKLTPLQAEKRKYGGLTARERQVAGLIGKGKSNREIADELVVTVRTVEAHVTHILQKLGYNSRTQVAAWAIDRGLATAPKTFEEETREPFDTRLGR